MSYAEKFYIAGGILAVAAVVVSFIGLKSEKFPGKAGPVVVLVFLAMIGVAATFAVQNGQEESEHHAELAHASAEAEEEEEEPVPGEESEAPIGEDHAAEAPAETPAPPAGKASTTIALAADPTDLAYDKKSLTAKSGRVTIAFTNPAVFEHDVAIEQDGEELAKTETFAEGEESLSTELAPGEYTFLCTVPGHAEAGMEGTLTVK